VRRLTVLYDARCGLCSTARRWLEGQRQIVPLELLAAGSEEARRRFPTLAAAEPEELVAVSDEGDVYRGSHAWIVCLWALEDYRNWSFRFARPSLLPLARNIVEWVSTRRHRLSRSVGLMSDHEIVLEVSSGASCPDRDCAPAPSGRTR
jgi:predicted DCC family thiol-disulfide oxidoreductase YuxK